MYKCDNYLKLISTKDTTSAHMSCCVRTVINKTKSNKHCFNTHLILEDLVIFS